MNKQYSMIDETKIIITKKLIEQKNELNRLKKKNTKNLDLFQNSVDTIILESRIRQIELLLKGMKLY